MRFCYARGACLECKCTNCESELAEASSKNVQFDHVVETVRLYTPSIYGAEMSVSSSAAELECTKRAPEKLHKLYFETLQKNLPIFQLNKRNRQHVDAANHLMVPATRHIEYSQNKEGRS